MSCPEIDCQINDMITYFRTRHQFIRSAFGVLRTALWNFAKQSHSKPIPSFYRFSEPEARLSEADCAGSSPAIWEAGSAIIDMSVE